MRSSSAVLGAVIALAAIAAAIFVGVAIHEIHYASKHRYAYGPAHVIAWGAGAGAMLSLAVAGLAAVLQRQN